MEVQSSIFKMSWTMLVHNYNRIYQYVKENKTCFKTIEQRQKED